MTLRRSLRFTVFRIDARVNHGGWPPPKGLLSCLAAIFQGDLVPCHIVSERPQFAHLRHLSDVSNRRILFSNVSGVEALRVSTLCGWLRSLRARSALDGVSWVQRGSVEIAVGHRLTACYKIRAVICSLPRASLLAGAGFGLLSWGLPGLGELELRPIPQHRMHDCKAAGQSDPRLAHR
jgi:hypothetical protein